MAKEHTIRNKEHDSKPPQMEGHPNFWIVEMFILLHRATLQNIRDKTKVYSKVMQVLFTSFFGGFVFLQLGKDYDQQSIQSRMGILFFSMTSSFMPFLMNILTMFPMERRVFVKEYSSGAYGSLSYFISKIATEFPLNAILPMMATIIIYFMVDLKMEADAFFVHYTAALLNSLCANSLGLLISTAFNNVQLSLVLAPLIFLPMMILGGLFANNSVVPAFIRWLKYFSIIKYAYEIVVVTEFESQTFECDQGQAICITTGEQALESFGMGDVDIGTNFGALCAYLVGMTVLAYLFLAFTLRNA
eukprot:TRINITY_DN1357_c0_g3_i1.p1 TRINITY_DN1357_c0_g3~~TRINITY_DN1357_c0_g3_i1.p1  ORF type:complete len:303 (-),score=73.95 TRINITY_DN1357_c0_g3_i1:31-939(-)